MFGCDWSPGFSLCKKTLRLRRFRWTMIRKATANSTRMTRFTKRQSEEKTFVRTIDITMKHLYIDLQYFVLIQTVLDIYIVTLIISYWYFCYLCNNCGFFLTHNFNTFHVKFYYYYWNFRNYFMSSYVYSKPLHIDTTGTSLNLQYHHGCFCYLSVRHRLFSRLWYCPLEFEYLWRNSLKDQWSFRPFIQCNITCNWLSVHFFIILLLVCTCFFSSSHY